MGWLCGRGGGGGHFARLGGGRGLDFACLRIKDILFNEACMEQAIVAVEGLGGGFGLLHLSVLRRGGLPYMGMR